MPLTHGDRYYSGAELTPHYAYQPGAPVTFLIGNPLRLAFFHAQHHGRVILQQSFGFNTRDFTTDLSTRRTNRASLFTEYVGVARGWRNLPDETSHVLALVQYYVVAWQPTQVVHRLSVDDGTNVDRATSTRRIDEDASRRGLFRAYTTPAGASAISVNDRVSLIGANPISGGWTIYEDRIVLLLSNVSMASPGNVEVRIESQANGLSDRTGDFDQPRDLGPLFVQAIAHMAY